MAIEGMEKLADVVLAGIVNATERPPVANCMAGSSSGATASETKLSVSRPVICAGYGAPNAIATLGCCNGSITSAPPSMLTLGTVAGITTSTWSRAAVNPLLSDTCTVNGKFPFAEGAPLMVPVAGSKLRPAGSAPAVMDHRYGGTPPEAASGCV